MELHHTFRFKADSRDGLIALGIIVFGVVVIALGTVALTRGREQEGGGEVALNVSARHGLDKAKDGGVQPPAGGLDDRR